MKILKYLIFLSILSGIFFVIYRQSDEKGFRRWWISFKIAVLIAASAAGLIPANTEAMKPPGNNNQVYQERIMDDQEFYALEENNQQVCLAKAEGKGSNPAGGVHGFSTNPKRPRPVTRPNRPVDVPKYRTAPKVDDQGLGAGANPAGAGGGGGAAEFDDQCSVPENKKSQESKFDYDYPSNAPKKKKQSSENQCPIDKQNKAGIDELPNSSEFIYKLETKTARKALKKVWKNPAL